MPFRYGPQARLTASGARSSVRATDDYFTICAATGSSTGACAPTQRQEVPAPEPTCSDRTVRLSPGRVSIQRRCGSDIWATAPTTMANSRGPIRLRWPFLTERGQSDYPFEQFDHADRCTRTAASQRVSSNPCSSLLRLAKTYDAVSSPLERRSLLDPIRADCAPFPQGTEPASASARNGPKNGCRLPARSLDSVLRAGAGQVRAKVRPLSRPKYL